MTLKCSRTVALLSIFALLAPIDASATTKAKAARTHHRPAHASPVAPKGGGEAIPESVATFKAPDAAYQRELRQRVVEVRRQMEGFQTPEKREPYRQAIASMAITFARQVEGYEALNQDDAAKVLVEIFPQAFNDVVWRLGHMSQQGHPGASLALGLLHRRGVLVEQSDEKACHFYGLAAERKEVLALYRQSICLSGKPEGHAALEEAARQGHPAAQEILGRACYERREGKDMTCALDWLTRASDAGRASAQALLGWIYYQGSDVAQDYRKAYGFYAAAAISGDRFAQNNLGECYELGRGVRKDATQAFFWYRKAAEAGLPAGEFNLGRVYLMGLGASADAEMAKHWLVVSKQHGVAEAQSLLDYLDGHKSQ